MLGERDEIGEGEEGGDGPNHSRYSVFRPAVRWGTVGRCTGRHTRRVSDRPSFRRSACPSRLSVYLSGRLFLEGVMCVAVMSGVSPHH